MNWMHEHLTNIIGGGSAGVGGAAFIGVMFRDSIKGVIDDWKESRRAGRAERLVAAGKTEAGLKEVIQLMSLEMKAQREMLAAQMAAQRENDKSTLELLGRMTTANERHLDMERQFSTQFSDFDKRLGEVKVIATIAAERRLQ